MELLFSHWHCILPIGLILIGIAFMSRGKSSHPENQADAPQNYDRDLE